MLLLNQLARLESGFCDAKMNFAISREDSGIDSKQSVRIRDGIEEFKELILGGYLWRTLLK